MQCDLYYATEQQNSYGAIVRNWSIDRTIPCSFYTLNDMSNKDNLDFDDKKFYRHDTTLFGRTVIDIRQTSDGAYHPQTHVLVTNIRQAGCDNATFFIETDGGYEGQPTVYEVKSLQPYIGPFNSIEYYKIQLGKADVQELNENA